MPDLRTATCLSAAATLLFAVSGCTVEEQPAKSDSSANAKPEAPVESPSPSEIPDTPPAGAGGAGDAGGTIEAFNGEMCSVLSTDTLENGLVIDELRIGEGPECPQGATVKMEYHGTLADGTVFDTTRGEGPRGPWPLARLIDGWQIGVPGMSAGGIRRLTIPYALGYGEAGGGPIPPRADLTFIIELTEFQP